MYDFESISNPNTSSNVRFTFDTGVDSLFLKEKIERRNGLASRLDKLVNEPTVGGYPFIKYILQTLQQNPVDPEELRTTARALERIAELLPPFRKLDEEVRGLSFVQGNTSLVALAFGSFDVPEDAESFLNLIGDDPTSPSNEET